MREEFIMRGKGLFSKALALVMIFTLLVCPVIASAEGQDFHIVKEGDVLWKIAKSSGFEESYVKLNPEI